MESQRSAPVPPESAREQLRAARSAADTSARRAVAPTGIILSASALCGAMTIAPPYKGPGHVASLVTVVWFLAELVRLSARNGWRPMRSWPKARWGAAEVALICVAVLVGGVIGPHVLAGRGGSALASWGLGTGVAVVMAACLFGATASYRYRARHQAWPR